MVFLKGIFRKHKPVDDSKRRSSAGGITRDVDPMDYWEIVNELGDGAFGKVYKTKRKDNDVTSALKKVEFDSETELDDFMVEIEILTQFKHPNILSLLEVYIYQSKLWMFLELCGGGALDSVMNTLEKPLTESQIRFVAREVLSGLQFLHEHLVIHRDMKAGNILLTSTNEVRLADFGVSARLANEKQMRHTFIGTPYWMAPEVIACESLRSSPYNWKADIWSFGITLIELAQMKPPHNEVNPSRVLIRIARSDPPTLVRPKMWSHQFSSIINSCLQKDPNSRPECSELLQHPFVAGVTEDDRRHIELLLCEAKAEVVDEVEDVDPASVPIDMDGESINGVLVLPDETKIEIPVELGDDDDINESEPTDNVAASTDESSTPLPAKPDPALVDHLTEELVDQLIEDVVTSEKRHPSVPSCLFEVMHELSEQTAADSVLAVPSVVDTPASKMKPVTAFTRHSNAYRTITRTRRFVVDGQEITSTTTRIVRANPREQKLRDDEMNQRKAELRAFRMLGKREAHQVRELTARATQQKEQVEAKFTAEFLAAKRTYEQKIEVISRNYRAQIERLEKDHEADLKRIRMSMAKEEHVFKEHLRSEVSSYGRAERKAAMRELQSDQLPNPVLSWNSGRIFSASNLSDNSSTGSVISNRLAAFRRQQDETLKERIHDATVLYFTRLNNIKKAEAVEKQSLRMGFEHEKWKMDQRHLRLRHQLARTQLRDFFVIKRQKLAGLLDLELNELRQTIVQERNTLSTVHAIERKNHAKHVKSTFKRSTAMVQRQCRSSHFGSTNQLKDQLRSNEEEIRRKLDEETQRLEAQQRKQLELLERSIFNRLKELELSHAARRNELVDLEAERLQELDDRYEYDLGAYAEALPQNLALLRSQFAKELDSIAEPIPTVDDIKTSKFRCSSGLPMALSRPPLPTNWSSQNSVSKSNPSKLLNSNSSN